MSIALCAVSGLIAAAGGTLLPPDLWPGIGYLVLLALLSPLLFRTVLAITGVYEAGYLLLAAGVATASFFLGRAALR